MILVLINFDVNFVSENQGWQRSPSKKHNCIVCLTSEKDGSMVTKRFP